MDFLDPAKKRQHNRRLFIGYFLIAIAVLALAYLLILQSYGYDYDRHTGQIIQNGLVYVSSHPVSGDVYVNGERKGSTTIKLTIPSGNYDFVIKSRGYRDWQTTINLEGGSIEQLTYPFLVPVNLTSTDAHLYTKKPPLASLSLDRHWLLVEQPTSLTDYSVFDITKTTTPAKSITLPSSFLKTASGSQSIKVVEWSSDNRHVLLQHLFKGGSEFIILDTQDTSKSFNVNKLIDVAPDKVVLRDKKFDQFYAYIAKTKSLLTINATSKQVNTALKNVIDFKAYGPNTILYTSDVSKVTGQYSVNILDSQKSYLLHNYPANSAYKLDMASYNHQTYVAVLPMSSNRLYIFKNPLDVMITGRVPNPFIALKINNPQAISFSNNARFIMAQSGSTFAGYDFEKNLWHYFNLKDNISLANLANWMDGHRMVINANGKINIFDFNGGNQQVLVPALTNFTGYFNTNYTGLYTLSTSANTPSKWAVTRTSMVVGQ